MKGLATAALATLLGAGLVGMAVVASAVAFLGGTPGGPRASADAAAKIPAAMLVLYQEAAETCPGLPWTVLAAIGTIESDNGQSTLPGVHNGANEAGAEGPLQFEPTTFAEYAEPPPPGGAVPPSPYDPTDAVYAATRLLCANGAAGGADIAGAIFVYNHSPSYVQQVLVLARSYGGDAPVDAGVSTAGIVAVQWALAQIGTPYVWGGETPGVGFDCSGLVQAAYAVAGIALPRIAQEQYDGTPKVAGDAPLVPGDLVFFGSGPSSIDHVGLYVGVIDGQSVMVDAPHSGADVRAEWIPSTVGSPFGDLVFVGATRPS